MLAVQFLRSSGFDADTFFSHHFLDQDSPYQDQAALPLIIWYKDPHWAPVCRTKALRRLVDAMPGLNAVYLPMMSIFTRTPSEPLALRHVAGLYLMHCCQLHRREEMSLHIQPPRSKHGLVAAFRFGLVQGTMLIAPSEESLERLRDEHNARSSEEDEYWRRECLRVSQRVTTVGQRAPTIQHREDCLRGDYPRNSRRFYFHWAGNDSELKEPVLDPDHERQGYFDLDASGLIARGHFYYPGRFGDNPLEITLVKIQNLPKGRPKPWSGLKPNRDKWHKMSLTCKKIYTREKSRNKPRNIGRG